MKVIKSKILKEKPQIKGLVKRLKTMKPKKPNSAQRKIALVKILKNKEIWVYIPGKLSKTKEIKLHSEVLIKGGKKKDLPGIKYKIEKLIK